MAKVAEEAQVATNLKCPECGGELLMRIFFAAGNYGIEMWCDSDSEDCNYNPIFFPEWDELIEEYGYGEADDSS